MAKPLNLLGSVLADNVDPVASGINAGIMNHGSPPEDSPMDVFQLIFISHHPAETSVTGVLGTVPWQLVSRSQQVLLEDKQDASRAEGMHTATRRSREKTSADGVAMRTHTHRLIKMSLYAHGVHHHILKQNWAGCVALLFTHRRK